ncbi:MAG: SprT family zinc-dependent metalloprotease [Patescibacteria group bacterium]
MPTIQDKEFGIVTVRRTARSSSMKATVAPNGSLRVSVPSYAPIFMVKRMIASSRSELRRLLETRPTLELKDGMSIGKSHTLVVRSGASTIVRKQGLQLIVTLAPDDGLNSEALVSSARTQVLAILRKEAKAHLPKRLRYLADTFGFEYSSVRFTHASSRWGSCNNKQAISLNIALMGLPFELIDYVLLHELAHTKQLNHSPAFWAEVARTDPGYVLHRKQLKLFNPHV